MDGITPGQLLALLALIPIGLPVAAAPVPERLGSCTDAVVASKRFRMVASPGDRDYRPTTDPFGKEVIISLNHGLSVYAGAGDAFLLSSNFAAGHPVRVCLQSVPQHCPPGDDRGRIYSLEDRLTGARQSGPDSWHRCGGA